MLNKAGRICLAKSIIAAMPVYSMQVFHLPRSIREAVDRRARDFIWGSKPGSRKWHTLNWSHLASPKELGGLGIRDASNVNLALLGKLVWSLLHQKHKLWVQVLTSKYLHGHDILHTPPVQGASFVWSSILKARDSLKDGFQFLIGNGDTTFWYTQWT